MLKFLRHRALAATLLTGGFLAQTITCLPAGNWDGVVTVDPGYYCCGPSYVVVGDDYWDGWHDFWDDFWDD